MLEDLDRIDWHQLETADGSADEVPLHLRSLASDKATERRRGFEWLSTYVNHQGLASPAAVEVVPFLVELCAQPKVKDKNQLLALLADLAVGGNHREFLGKGLAALLPSLPTAHLLSQLNTRAAAGLDTYLALLADKAASVRAAAALVLAFLPTRAGQSATALRARAQVETAPAVKASVILALGFADSALAEHADRALFQRSLEEPTLVRVAAAIALISTEGPHADEQVVDELLRAFTDTGGPIPDLPWNGGDLGDFAIRALLTSAGEREDVETLRRILRETATGPVSGDAACAVLRAVLPQKSPATELRRLDELTAAQRSVLEELAQLPSFHSLFDTLQARGLFSLQKDLRRFLGVDPRGALDREVDGEPLWRHLRRTLDGKAPEATWYEMLARTSTPAQIVEACADAAEGAYELYRRWPWTEPGPMAEAEDEHKLEHLLARTLARFSDVRHVTEYAESLRPQLPQRVRASAVAAAALSSLLGEEGKVLGPELDDIVARGIFDSYAPDMREVLRTLPLERRVQLVMSRPFKAFRAQVGGQPQLVARGAWLYADLCPAQAMAEKVVNEVRRWKMGQEVPAEAAVSALVTMGAIAVPFIEAALADGLIPCAEVLQRALAALRLK